MQSHQIIQFLFTIQTVNIQKSNYKTKSNSPFNKLSPKNEKNKH